VVRTASGELAFDEAFVPPVLSVRASGFLQTELRRLLEALVGRQAALKRTSSRDASEAVQRWLSSLLGSFIPRVADLMNQRHVHPLVMYRVLAELLGALAAFTRDGEYRVPPFDYDHLGPVFSDLFGSLTVVLDALGAEQHRRIALQRYDHTTLFAELKEPAIFRNDFYLGVAGNDVETLRAHVPGHFKIAAWSELGVVVRTATAGVPLHLAARPPSTLPDGNGLVYFKLEKTGAFAAIFKTGQLGECEAAGVVDAELALFAVDPGAT
jgi:type VI secretion system protein ImpJ